MLELSLQERTPSDRHFSMKLPALLCTVSSWLFEHARSFGYRSELVGPWQLCSIANSNYYIYSCPVRFEMTMSLFNIPLLLLGRLGYTAANQRLTASRQEMQS